MILQICVEIVCQNQCRDHADSERKEKDMCHGSKLSENKILLLIFLTVGSLVITLNSCSNESKTLRGDPYGTNFPLSRTESDSRKIDFDPSKPYRLEIGRGSGWLGLNTIKIEENGSVAVYILKEEQREDVIYSYCENGLLKLAEEDMRIIADKIAELEILDMDRSYYAEGISDGTQWIFWIQQDKKQKSIYFSNHFPKKIQDVAVFIDEILENAGYKEIEWKRIPDREIRFHEIDIWNSIKKK
ncbi:MAG: hypothetical protein GY749_50500 [Desulfobacteraceae bacterium]|nr:hypothetical protein [Desulfobacteraceae bacterium]